MDRKTMTIAGVATTGLFTLCGAAHADILGTVTADNHYAVYADNGGALSLIGGNETGAGGSPGQYNWSIAETHQFEAADDIYIAAWSDNNVAQGLLAEFNINGVPRMSGDGAWQVYATGDSRNDGDAYPSTQSMSAHIMAADLGNLWTTPEVGEANLPSTNPWGQIDDVSSDARWMWHGGEGGGNGSAFTGGADHGEYLIFHTSAAVPAPAAGALLIGAGLLGRRRRRR